MGEIGMTVVRTTHQTFILSVPPVGGLPILQDWLDKMMLVRDHLPIRYLNGPLPYVRRHITVLTC